VDDRPELELGNTTLVTGSLSVVQSGVPPTPVAPTVGEYEYEFVPLDEFPETSCPGSGRQAAGDWAGSFQIVQRYFLSQPRVSAVLESGVSLTLTSPVALTVVVSGASGRVGESIDGMKRLAATPRGSRSSTE
jgi:hypothetical protein